MEQWLFRGGACVCGVLVADNHRSGSRCTTRNQRTQLNFSLFFSFELTTHFSFSCFLLVFVQSKMALKRTRDEEKKGVVLSCFDLSGIFVENWAKAGYECHLVDLQHPQRKETRGNVTRWGMDVFEWEKIFFKECKDKVDKIEFAAFFPPCTDLAVSGARWFAEKEISSPGTRKRAMDLVFWSDRIGKTLECPYFIENPVSVISSEWRRPDFSFHQYEFGGYNGGEEDGYTKKTCLWTGGGFDLPFKKPIKLDPKISDKIWKMPPCADRQNLRSKTPRGFSRAIFEMYAERE